MAKRRRIGGEFNIKSNNKVRIDTKTHDPIILDDIDVLATLIRLSLPKESTFVANWSCINFRASLHANR